MFGCLAGLAVGSLVLLNVVVCEAGAGNGLGPDEPPLINIAIGLRNLKAPTVVSYAAMCLGSKGSYSEVSPPPLMAETAPGATG